MSNQRYDLASSNYLQDSHSELDFVYTPTVLGPDNNPLSARLLYVTAAKYEGDWHSLTHSHAFSELFFVSGGKGQFLANGELYEVAENDLVIINPLVEHTELSLESNPLEYIVLGIDGLQFMGNNDNLSSFSAIRLPHITGKVRQYMNMLLLEVQSADSQRSAICQNLLNILLILILSHHSIEISITASRNISSECAALKRYIDRNFKESLTLDDLAKASHQNKYYVAHAFKDAFGISPIRYLTERRIDESKRLLAETDYSVGEISSMVGFASFSVFSQTFKRVTSMKPNEYRKHAQAK